MSKIFVTGGTGFVAKHLIPKLQSLGHDVITNWRYWDDKYHVIIHLAAETHTRNEFDPKLIESNYILTNKVFKKPCRIVYASSCSAKHFSNPYAGSKMWAEYLGEKHGNAVGLRFHNIYGPKNNKGIVWWLMQQPDGVKINVRGPEIVRDYIYVDTVVDEIVSHLSGIRFTVPVDVGTGIGTQTMDLVNLYMKLSGKSFIIDVSEAWGSEPKEMVAEYGIPGALTLEQGLLKTING